jgi:hypothetical protein
MDGFLFAPSCRATASVCHPVVPAVFSGRSNGLMGVSPIFYLWRQQGAA